MAGPQTQLGPLETQEQNLIRQALSVEDGFIRRAAHRLNMSHQALLRRLDKWPELRQFTRNSSAALQGTEGQQ